MPKVLKLWQVKNGKPLECSNEGLDLEVQLENWLEQDISLLDPELLLIGRQVSTDLGLSIDLLCIDENGDLVVIELKRGRTHREVVAQLLDYGAWAHLCSSSEIERIANDYLKDSGPLEEAFRNKFQHDLPDSIGTSHRLLILAQEIDERTERIVTYLSEQYGISMNAVTFDHYKTSDGLNLLARVFLLEPEAVELSSRSGVRSKRLPNLSYEELLEIAGEAGQEQVLTALSRGLQTVFSRGTTRSSVTFHGTYEGSRRVIVGLYPGKRDAEGLYYNLYLDRICSNLELPCNDVIASLPKDSKPWKYHEGAGPDYSGYQGYFKNTEEVSAFLAVVKQGHADSI